MADSKKKDKKKTTLTDRSDKAYFKALNSLIDVLFQEAFKQKLDWSDMGSLSGLSVETVRRLGARETRFPQFRTVEKLANALGGHLDFSASAKRRIIKKTWTLKIFANRREAA